MGGTYFFGTALRVLRMRDLPIGEYILRLSLVPTHTAVASRGSVRPDGLFRGASWTPRCLENATGSKGTSKSFRGNGNCRGVPYRDGWSLFFLNRRSARSASKIL